MLEAMLNFLNEIEETRYRATDWEKWNEKVIGIAGNDTSLSWSRIFFDVPEPLLSIDEGRK